MSTLKDLADTLRELSALKIRTDDLARANLRIEEKLDDLRDRLTRLERDHLHMRESVGNQILGDIKADFARLQARWDNDSEGSRMIRDRRIKE